MKSLFWVGGILTILMVVVPTSAEPLLLAGEVAIELPPGWLLDGSPDVYPFRFVNEEHPADLLIHKAVLERRETITDETELRMAVDQMIQDVILDLPDGDLMTTSGLYHNNRTEFILDFTSEDTTSHRRLRHRLEGIIYRHTDGYQILFSVWGKADEAYWEAVADDIRAIQASFSYSGPVADEVFGEPSRGTWWYALMLLLLIVLVYLLYKRRGAGDHTILAGQDSFWRCSCQRLNHIRSESCRRCGQPRPSGVPTP
jgi:hypothetical protein